MTLGVLVWAPLVLAASAAVASHCLRPENDENEAADPSSWWAIATAWAIGVIPMFALWLNLMAGTPLQGWVLGCFAALNLALIRWLRRDLVTRSWIGTLRPPRAPSWAALAPLGAALAVAAIYALRYDGAHPVHDSCIYNAARAALGQFPEAVNLWSENLEDARLGNSALLAGSALLFGGAGWRAIYAISGFLVALGAFIVGRDMGGSRRYGWLALVIIPLNPYTLSIALPDENLFTLAISGALAPLLLKRKPGGGVFGVLFGLVVLCRHIMVLALPAVVFALRGSTRRLRWTAIGAFLVTVGPALVRHRVALESWWRFESHEQFPAFPYDIFGVEVLWNGMLNWPFVGELIRTPHNPFPTMVLWPLHLADRLGLVIFGLMLCGFVAIWWTRKKKGPNRAVLWALWALPSLGALAVQEAWDQPNKMGVVVMLFLAFAAWLVAGTAWVVRRPRWGVGVMVVIAAVGLFLVPAMRDWRVPIDERYVYTWGAMYQAEIPAVVDREAARQTDLDLWPDYSVVGPFDRGFIWHNLRELGRQIVDGDALAPSYPLQWFRTEIPSAGAPVTIAIDLSAAPGEVPYVIEAEGEPHLDITAAPADRVELQVPWDDRTVRGLATRSQGVNVVHFDFVMRHNPTAWDDAYGGENGVANSEEQRCGKIGWLLGRETYDCPGSELEPTQLDSPIIRVRMPAGALTASWMLSPAGETLLLWKALVTSEGITILRDAVPFWHN